MAVSDVIQGAADARFLDPNIGDDGTYTAPNGAAVAVRVEPVPADDAALFFEVGARHAGWQVRVRVSDVPAPVAGALVQFDGQSFLVRDYESDTHDTVWTLDLDPWVNPVAVTDDVSVPWVFSVGLL